MKLRNIILFFLLIAVCYSICVSYTIYLYGGVDETKTSDAAIILGAAVWDDKPSPVFEERIKHGIWLYKNGYVDKLIFTGGKGRNKEYSESFIAKQYAIKCGVPENKIFIEELSGMTEENLEFAARIVAEKNLLSVLIVSDPLHMKRAMLIAKDCKLQAYSSPTKTTKFRSTTNKIKLLVRETFFYTGYKIHRLFR